MTDQPLPLKPWDTEMDDELENIIADYFERAEGKGWPNGVQAVYAYCWKLLAEKEAEIEELKRIGGEASFVVHIRDEEVDILSAKIQEQAEQIKC